MSWLKRPILLACVMSCIAHVLFVALTPASAPRPARNQTNEVELTLLAMAAPQPTTVEAASEAVPEPSPARTEKSPRSSAVRPTPAVATEPAPAEPAAQVEEIAAVQPAPARTPSAGSIDLSPRAAAATLTAEIEKQLAAGSCNVARAGATCAGGDAEGTLAPKPVQRGTAARMPGNHEYLLEPARGGGYVHSSPGFSARIEPNGDVHFDDKLRDLNDVVTSLVGVQAYTAQKRRFLEQTAELRERLADEALAKNQVRGLAELSHQLQRIVRDTSRSGLQKRIAIFALWDDCANDTLGAEAQHTIEAFVREHLAEDSALAYSTAELSELNRRRVSKRVFAPYRGDAGAQAG